jgi:hypothetical protein
MPAQDVDLTQVVIGAAIKVLNTLRPGLDEKLYERALVIELRKQGLPCDQQKQHEVFYDDQLIGVLVPDLNITGLKTALLLNFKYAKLGIKRVSNCIQPQITQINADKNKTI